MQNSIVYQSFDPNTDWPLFLEAETESHENTHNTPLSDKLLESRKKDLLAFIKNDDFFVKTIVFNNVKIGMVLFGKKSSHTVKIGFLFNIYIKSAFRNSKIGERILNDLIKFSKERGFIKIGLIVGAHNFSAIRLYEKTGFQSEEIVMELKLTP
jgi:ribosomal protein S18 acetylase RimI-like enzyme